MTAAAENIEITIIVPVRDEEAYLARCLESISASDVPQEQMEVLVIDGGSVDGSRAIVQQLARRFPNIIPLENPQQTPSAAMNVGIRHARGKYIIRMDAHSAFPPDYVRLCVEELERTGAENVGFPSEACASNSSAVARTTAMWGQHLLGVGPSAFRLGWSDRDVDTVPFGAFRRSLFEQIGLYREDLVRHQDFELNARIRAAGGRVYLSNKTYSHYYARPTLASFTRQGAMNGFWNARSWVVNRACFTWRHSLPMFFVLFVIAAALAGFRWKVAWVLGGAALGAYILMLSLAGVQLAIRHGARFMFLVPVVFGAHQIAYGAMEVVGLLSMLSFVRQAGQPPRLDVA